MLEQLRDFYSHSDSKQNGWNARRPVLDDEAPLASVPLEPLTLEHLLCEVNSCVYDCVNSTEILYTTSSKYKEFEF